MSYNPKWVALQIVYREALTEIERLFLSRSYRFMPIKGAYLIRSGLAETIERRRMYDLDLLLPEEDFEEICRWFESLPQVCPCPGYWDFERPCIVTSGSRQIYVELHRLVNTPNRFVLPNEKLFGRGVPVTGNCVFPDPVDALLIHICHKLLHVIDGFEPQFYREVVLYARQKGFSWKLFWERAETTGILPFIWLVVHRCSTQLQTRFPLPPSPSVYAAFLGRFNLFMRCRSRMGRRLFFEVPFVRSVGGLLWYNVNARRNAKKR